MPDNKTVGDRIKALREKKNYSQETLAKMIGVAVSTICMYETDSSFGKSNLFICKCTQNSTNRIYTDENYPLIGNKIIHAIL